MRTLDSLIWDIADIQAGEAVIICHDPTLDLTRTALSSGAEVVFADADYTRCQEARALGAEVVGDVRIDDYLSGASGTAVAIGEMPKSLARLDYLARSIASAGYSQARVVLGANNKHLSRGMNAVLGESFQDVAASLGRGKFRCLVASGPRDDVSYAPVRGDGLVAVGGVFSGAKPDRGGELLRSCLPDEPGRLLVQIHHLVVDGVSYKLSLLPSGVVRQGKLSVIGNGVVINWRLPKEGAPIWFDTWAIPKSAQNVDEAHAFINHLLEPGVIAPISDFLGYPNPNVPGMELVGAEIADDHDLTPTPELQKSLYVVQPLPQKIERVRTRAWT